MIFSQIEYFMIMDMVSKKSLWFWIRYVRRHIWPRKWFLRFSKKFKNFNQKMLFTPLSQIVSFMILKMVYINSLLSWVWYLRHNKCPCKWFLRFSKKLKNCYQMNVFHSIITNGKLYDLLSKKTFFIQKEIKLSHCAQYASQNTSFETLFGFLCGLWYGIKDKFLVVSPLFLSCRLFVLLTLIGTFGCGESLREKSCDSNWEYRVQNYHPLLDVSLSSRLV